MSGAKKQKNGNIFRLFIMNVLIQTSRLILQPWAINDMETLFKICRDPEVMLHIGNGQPFQNLLEAQRFLEWAVDYQRENGFCRWKVFEKTSNKIIGSCGFARLESIGEIELGYLFARGSWGKGYASEAAQACLNYGFEQLGFSKVVALTNPHHTASQKVVEKIGLISKGVKNLDGKNNMIYEITNPNYLPE
jgi:ribosomal-protein-alanine N-acetyltransferase